MPVFLIAALGVALVVAIAALIVLTVAILRLLKAANRMNAALEPPLARLAASGEGLTVRSEQMAAGQLRLQESFAELQASRAHLETLRWGLEEPLRLYRLLRMVIPAK